MTQKKMQEGFAPGRGYSEEDWNEVDSPELTEEELARMRPAREVLPPEFFAGIEEARRQRGRPPLDRPKRLVTLRLDQDVVEKFEALGKGWRSRINDALKQVKL